MSIKAPMNSIEIDLDVFKAIEADRTSFSESHNDILRRKFRLAKKRATTGDAAINERNDFQTRRTGDYTVVFKGKTRKYKNLRDAYVGLLEDFCEHEDDALRRISSLETRSRMLIAKNPEGLYKRSKHLSRQHAARFVGDYWVDTNLSQEQVLKRLEMVAGELGLEIGVDMILEFPAP